MQQRKTKKYMDGQPKKWTGKSYKRLLRIVEDREQLRYMTFSELKALDYDGYNSVTYSLTHAEFFSIYFLMLNYDFEILFSYCYFSSSYSISFTHYINWAGYNCIQEVKQEYIKISKQ